jgi:hypothetical protein
MDGIDIAGLSSKREHHNFNYLPAATVIEVSFSIKLNLTPGTYFFNVGVDGNDAQGARTYLHRRVDMYMIRVLPPASQEIYGLAYLEPRFSYAIQTNISPALIEVKIP